jgi:hypothetical protein
MSNAIVMNTLTGAVSEYRGFAFHSVTPTQAGSATSLYTFGGDLDVAASIVGEVRTGTTGGKLKLRPEAAYFSTPVGSGAASFSLVGDNTTYTYSFPVRAPGVSRSGVGKGIRESYMAFGFTKTDGLDFSIDRIEISLAQSNTRRI